MSNLNILDTRTPLNPRAFGVVGDGVADDTAALQATIDAAPDGGWVLVPAGTYLVSATVDNNRNLVLAIWKSLRFEMEPGATIKLAPNNLAGYSILDVGNPGGGTPVAVVGVEIVGGRVEGNGLGNGMTPVKATQGHGIRIWSKRVTVRDMFVTRCGGDGIFVAGPAGNTTGFSEDVSIINCHCHDNGRNGISIDDANRIAVIGGSMTANGSDPDFGDYPGVGINVEPQPGRNDPPDVWPAQNVTGCVIDGVASEGNFREDGEGNAGGAVAVSGVRPLVATDTVGLIDVVVADCTSEGDGDYLDRGAFSGSAGLFVGCATRNAHGDGFSSTELPQNLWTTIPPAKFVGCHAYKSAKSGFLMDGEVANDATTAVELSDCTAVECGQHGFFLGPNSADLVLSSCVALRNGQTDEPMVEEKWYSFDVEGAGHLLLSCYGSADSAAPELLYNYFLDGEAPAHGNHQLRDCIAGVAGTDGQYRDESDGSVAWPRPGSSPLDYPLGLVAYEEADADSNEIEDSWADTDFCVDWVPSPGPRRIKISWELIVTTDTDNASAGVRLIKDGETEPVREWAFTRLKTSPTTYYRELSGYVILTETGPEPPTGDTVCYDIQMKRTYPTSGSAKVVLRHAVFSNTDRKSSLLVEDIGPG